jgi:TetR/AcrR family transcriptional regulator
MATVTEARRARERRQRREAILHAAEAVFLDRGPAAATMDEVAEAAEVSKGTLYLYFRSKDELFVALSHRPLHEVTDRFEAIMADAATSGATLLGRLLDVHLDVLTRHGPRLRVAMGSLLSGYTPGDSSTLERYRGLVGRVRRAYVTALERGQRDGSIRDDVPPARLATAIWGALFGSALLRSHADELERRNPDPSVDFDRMVPDVATMLRAALEAR